ncbi:MAG TPA: hypothetical protein VGM86_04490 [Thermoanaerobaculia bacterium]|jgi:hypothetical protein
MEKWELIRKGQIIDKRAKAVQSALQAAGYLDQSSWVKPDNTFNSHAALKSLLVDYLHFAHSQPTGSPLGLSDLREAIEQAYAVYEQEIAPFSQKS